MHSSIVVSTEKEKNRYLHVLLIWKDQRCIQLEYATRTGEDIVSNRDYWEIIDRLIEVHKGCSYKGREP